MFIQVKDILSLIPQRPPFVMIDSLIFSDDTQTRTGFKVRADNIFISGEKLLEAGLVENIAQTAAARAGYESKVENKPVSIGYIGSVSNLVIDALPKIGDELETVVDVVNQVFNVTIIKGKILYKDKVLAQCEMKIFITPTK